MENKNEDNNNDDLDDSDKRKDKNIVIKIDRVFKCHTMTKMEELGIVWNKILGFAKDVQKKELLTKYFEFISRSITNELQENKLDSKRKNHHLVLNFFKNNIILEKTTNFIISAPNNREIFLWYSSYFLNLLKFREDMIKDNKLLKKTILQTTIHLFEELKKYKIKFKLKNEFSLFLNIVRKENIYTHSQYDDYFIFSCLLILLEIDETIQEFEYKKYIRRSIIVYLSFDEIINSFYFQNKINFVEVLINKLCNYYQMLPEYFDFEKTTGSLEIGCNLHFNFESLCPKYFDYVDYISLF